MSIYLLEVLHLEFEPFTWNSSLFVVLAAQLTPVQAACSGHVRLFSGTLFLLLSLHVRKFFPKSCFEISHFLHFSHTTCLTYNFCIIFSAVTYIRALLVHSHAGIRFCSVPFILESCSWHHIIITNEPWKALFFMHLFIYQTNIFLLLNIFKQSQEYLILCNFFLGPLSLKLYPQNAPHTHSCSSGSGNRTISWHCRV